jgi:hypothetical protein
MQGTILGHDAAADLWSINAENGLRLTFGAAEWKGPEAPLPGQQVDFVVDATGSRASGVFPTVEALPPLPAPNNQIAPAETSGTPRSRMLGWLSIGGAVGGLLIPALGFVPAIAGMVLGIMGRSAADEDQDDEGRTLATVGLVLSGIFLLLQVVLMASILIGFAWLWNIFGGLLPDLGTG